MRFSRQRYTFIFCCLLIGPASFITFTFATVSKKLIHHYSLPAQYADSVDLKDGLLNSRVCTVKFPATEAYLSSNKTHTKVLSIKMDMEVW